MQNKQEFKKPKKRDGGRLTVSQRLAQLKLWVPTLFLLMKNPRTPIMAKIMAGITVGYALSPIDLIPDFIPILGYLDDLLILPLFVWITIKMVPDSLLLETKALAYHLWDKGKPKKWYYSIPILMIWLLAAWWIVGKLLDFAY